MPSDSIPLKKSDRKSRSRRSKEHLDEPSEHDDFAGMIVNAGKSINVREMIIIWLWFLLIHSEIFIEKILSIVKGAVDESGIHGNNRM